MKKTIAAILAGALCLTALTACGGKTDTSAADSSNAAGDADKTITIGATPTPHAEILNAAKDALEAEGYTLNVIETPFRISRLPRRSLRPSGRSWRDGTRGNKKKNGRNIHRNPKSLDIANVVGF